MADPLDLTGKSDGQLAALIRNHEAQRAFGAPLYAAALQERARRARFDIGRSVAAIAAAARERRFISYGDLAKANGVPWAEARVRIFRHLDDLVGWSKAEGLPVITAIVVNQERLATGDMDEETLAGFVRGMERLGYPVADPLAFLRHEQAAVFAYYADR